jgi:hypothetical protein
MAAGTGVNLSAVPLQASIDIARSAAFRCIARYVLEIAMFTAFGTRFRKGTRRKGEPAFGTFPVSQTTFWTDIALELA